MRGRHRGRLVVGQAGGQRDGEAGVTGDERGPTAVSGKAADTVTDPVVGDIRADRGDHAGEIHTQLWQAPVDAGESAHGDEDIGEVDAGCGDRDLDLPGPGGTRSNAASSIVSRSPGVRICSRIPSCSWSTTVVRRSSGRSGAGHKRAVYHSPFRQAVSSSSDPLQQLPRHLLGIGVLVYVDLGGAQMRMFGADHPHQATQPGLLQIGAVVGQHRSGRSGSPGTGEAARPGFPALRRRCAPDARTYPRPAKRTLLVGVAVLSVR